MKPHSCLFILVGVALTVISCASVKTSSVQSSVQSSTRTTATSQEETSTTVISCASVTTSSVQSSTSTTATSREGTFTVLVKPKDYRKEPFQRMVILGESTVEGGPWLADPAQRYADLLANYITQCQGAPIEYHNKGIGANAISPRSPGYADSRKPSAMERYQEDVIALKPDLFILAYGLNDMRAGMSLDDFREDMATIIRDVKAACDPVIVLTTVYYMTGWKSYPPYDKGSVELTLLYNDCIRDLAEEYDCILADVWSVEGGADWLIDPDGVHANRAGNIVIAGKIFEALAQHASCLSLKSFNDLAGTKWRKDTTSSRASVGDPFKKTW